MSKSLMQRLAETQAQATTATEPPKQDDRVIAIRNFDPGHAPDTMAQPRDAKK